MARTPGSSKAGFCRFFAVRAIQPISPWYSRASHSWSGAVPGGPNVRGRTPRPGNPDRGPSASLALSASWGLGLAIRLRTVEVNGELGAALAGLAGATGAGDAGLPVG